MTKEKQEIITIKYLLSKDKMHINLHDFGE